MAVISRLLALALLLLGVDAFLRVGVPTSGAVCGVARSRAAPLYSVDEGKGALKKNELVDMMVEETGMTKTAVQKMLGALTDAVTKSLSGGKKVNLAGIGTFSPSVRAARTGRNPRTGEPLELPETTVVSFAPSKTLKDKLNNRQ